MGAAEMRAAPPTPYRPPGRLGAALVLLLGVDAALALLAVQAGLLLVEFAWHALSGRFLPGADLGSVPRQLAGLRALQVLAAAATAGVAVAWGRRMWANLPALGASGPGPRRPPGRWRLFRPPRAVTELWRASDPRGRPPPDRPPAPVAWWWGLLLASLAAEAGGLLGGPGRSWPATGPGPILLTDGLRLAAAVLAIAVVVRIDGFQDARFRAGPRPRDA
jgi:hypothetical protein